MGIKRDHEDHLPRYQGAVDEDHQQNMADGYTFHARYLSFAPMSKPPTALGIIQPPLKDLYVKCRKPGGEANIRRVMLRVIRGGLLFTFLDQAQKGEVFFDITSMIYFEGLQFQMVRANEKKPYGMFVPFDSNKITPKDHKSAFVLDKNIQFLAQTQHPPLLTCVLRRPKGIKALDCHLFEFDTIEDVYHLQTLLNGLQSSGGNLPEITDNRQTDPNFNRGQKSDVIRTEYGDYAIYRGNQMELKDDFFRPRDENPAFDQMEERRDDRRDERYDDRRDDRRDDRYDDRREDRRDERRDDRRDERRDDRREDKVQDKKNYDWDYDSSPIDNAWRSVNKQFTNEERPKTQEPEYRRQEYERQDNLQISHSRDRSGDSNEGRFSGGKNLVDSDRGRYDERQYKGSPHPHPKVPPPVAEKPSSPRPLSPNGQQRFQGGMYGGPPPRDDPRGDPRGNPYNPRYAGGGPPQGSGGPVFSASNLEGRKGDRSSKGEDDLPPKPVAKVPPHLVAGIKVLPTNFNILGVKLKPRSPNHEKGIDKGMDKGMEKGMDKGMEKGTDRKFSSEGSDDHEYDNVLQKFDKMISDESVELRSQAKPTQRDRELYDQNIRKNWVNEDPRNNRESPRPERGNYHPEQSRVDYDGSEERRYIMDQYDQRRNIDNRAEPWIDPRVNPNRNSIPQMYDRGERSYESPNRWSGSNKSQSSYEMGGGGGSRQLPPGVTPENPDHNLRKKDAEIANMFVGGRERGDHSPFIPVGNNFEQSLGYYP